MFSYSNRNLLVYVTVCCPFVEFFSNRRQRVVADGATSEWIPIVSGLPQKCVGSSSIHPIYQRNFWAGGEQTIYMYIVYAYADDPTHMHRHIQYTYI